MKKLIYKTYNIAHKRKWNKVTWAIDIHDVILGANYKAGDIPKNFLGDSKKVLQRLSKRADTTLVLFTCSHPHEIVEYLQFFKENDINFKYTNENLDCPNTAFGCFEKKFYFNILLEDKAGFDAETDWKEINEALDVIEDAKVVEILPGEHTKYWYKDHVGKEFLAKYYEVPAAIKHMDGFTTIDGKWISVKDCKVISPLDITKYTGR